MPPLQPVEPPFSPEIEAILARYPQQDGYLLSLFRTFANSRRFLESCVPNLLDEASPLDLHARELVILRTTANRSCAYEWGVHVSIFSKVASLSEQQVLGTTEPAPTCFDDRDLALIKIVDQLCHQSSLDDHAEEAFERHWDAAQQLEIIALVGTYTTVSLVANTAKLPPEPFAASFPVS